MKRGIKTAFLMIASLGIILVSCSVPAKNESGIKVVASTTLVGDVVQQIGGNKISLTVLLPVGADPHNFEPRPQDAVAISEAQIIFLNGLELEHSLEPLITSNAKGPVIEVSQGIEVLPFNETAAQAATSQSHDHATGDPHTWMDPTLVKIWVANISSALSAADPDNAEYYKSNSQLYETQLTELDAWIQIEVASIPAAHRKLVTDHESLGYFSHRYGFELVGLVVPSLSSSASPSAQELATLEDTILTQGVPAILVDTTVNPSLSQQVAKDTNIKIISIYNGSLGDTESGVTSYIKFMRANVQAIVDGLK
ncbi:MAG: zinc ABC transporter substrate-binding protein [Chloroflexi bacterium]|nr:zinc ABC transporter substrate-binding protein [Chloroflexota bacterium]